MNKTLLALASAALLASGTAGAAELKMINLDAPGVGLNDATPATPTGGNPGKTRGQQAVNVYTYAMKMWGSVLQSPVEIRVNASFAPLACTSTSGTLGSAGTTYVIYLTSGSTTRVYGSALTDALIGYDAIPGEADISSRFNGNLGLPGCLDGSGWYFGLDGKTPAGQINFLNVVMHEIGHGLGFQGFLNKSTGALFNGYSDPYTYYAYDNVLNKSFEAMTSAERALAMRTPGRTVWTGARVNHDSALTLNTRNALRATAPAAIAGKNYEIGYATFGTFATPSTFPNRAMVLVNDGVGAASDGCELPFVNSAALAGKTAVIDRGTCGFSQKVKNAQDAGAAAVVIVNNTGGVIDMGLTAGYTPTIPSVMVSLADGNEIKANIAGAYAGVSTSPFLAGADNSGRTRLYSPTTVATGSTFSHFDTALLPNALMEPAITDTLNAQMNVDMTPALFADIGWTLNPGNAKIGSCDTTVDAVADGGIVLGANVAAQFAMCKVQYPGNKAAYTKCMSDYAGGLRAAGLLTSTQQLKIAQCASAN